MNRLTFFRLDRFCRNAANGRRIHFLKLNKIQFTGLNHANLFNIFHLNMFCWTAANERTNNTRIKVWEVDKVRFTDLNRISFFCLLLLKSLWGKGKEGIWWKQAIWDLKFENIIHHLNSHILCISFEPISFFLLLWLQRDLSC